MQASILCPNVPNTWGVPGSPKHIQWQHVPCSARYIEYHHSAWFMICIDNWCYHYHPKIIIVLFQLIHVSSVHQTSNWARCQSWCNPYIQEFLIPSRLTEQYVYIQTCKIKWWATIGCWHFFLLMFNLTKGECFDMDVFTLLTQVLRTCFDKTPPLHVGHGKHPQILDDHVVKVGSLKCHLKM